MQLEGFNTQPPEGGWCFANQYFCFGAEFQHTAARRRLDFENKGQENHMVSTHSRPKAAGPYVVLLPHFLWGFNTQPPEGGWRLTLNVIAYHSGFQHTAARRRLAPSARFRAYARPFQHTAARRRLAPSARFRAYARPFQHTAARRRLGLAASCARAAQNVSTHSRPKAAGYNLFLKDLAKLCFNTQPPEGGWLKDKNILVGENGFNTQPPEGGWAIGAIPRIRETVSTHSRPKAAGRV